jgi:hypothetical protein
VSDNTPLQSGTGGDDIRTESLQGGTDQSSGLPLATTPNAVSEIKVQLIKMLTGRSGVDGGPVLRGNELPVVDRRLVSMAEAIYEQNEIRNELLREIRDAVVG